MARELLVAVQLRLVEEGDPLPPVEEVVPEPLPVRGAREPARHADDGDVTRVLRDLFVA
jgi:hypothetical protein